MNTPLRLPAVAAVLLACVFAGSARAQTRGGAAGAFDGHTDVGAPARPGSVEYDAAARSYRVAGGGANMWATNDAFQFVWKKVSGDASLAADVAFAESGGNPHKKACLVIRQNLDPDCAYADAAVHGSGETALQYRAAKGAATLQIKSEAKAPKRLRIEKKGGSVSVSYAGADGEWHAVEGSVKLSFDGPFYIGLAVCAHDDGRLERAVFSNLELK
jgi:TolB protein